MFVTIQLITNVNEEPKAYIHPHPFMDLQSFNLGEDKYG